MEQKRRIPSLPLDLWQRIAQAMGPPAWVRSGARACRAFNAFHFDEAVVAVPPEHDSRPDGLTLTSRGISWLAAPERWGPLRKLTAIVAQPWHMVALAVALSRSEPSQRLEAFQFLAIMDAPQAVEHASFFLLLLQRFAPALRALALYSYHGRIGLMPAFSQLRQLHLVLSSRSIEEGLLRASLQLLTQMQTLSIANTPGAQELLRFRDGIQLGNLPELHSLLLDSVMTSSLVLPPQCQLAISGNMLFVAEDIWWREAALQTLCVQYWRTCAAQRGGPCTLRALSEVLPQLWDGSALIQKLSICRGWPLLCSPFSLSLAGLQGLRSLSITTCRDISVRFPATLPLQHLRLCGLYLSHTFQDVKGFARTIEGLALRYDLLTNSSIKDLGRALLELRGLSLVTGVRGCVGSEQPCMAYILGRRAFTAEAREHDWDASYCHACWRMKLSGIPVLGHCQACGVQL